MHAQQQPQRETGYDRPLITPWRRDYLLLSMVPLVLGFVYLLPIESKRALLFVYMEPTILTAYSAHFVHLSPGHMISNIVGYALVVTVGYSLAIGAQCRQTYLRAVFMTLVVGPPILSLLSLVFPRDGILYGFSGIIMILHGFIALLLFEYARTQLWSSLDVRLVTGFFFASIGLITILAVPLTGSTLSIAGVAVALSCLEVHGHTDWRRSWRLRCRDLIDGTGRGDPVLIGCLVYVGYLFVAFPSTAVIDGQIVNLYVHFVGFGIGFLSWYTLRTIEWTTRWSTSRS